MTTKVKEMMQKMTPRKKEEAAGAEPTRPGVVFTPAVDILESEGEIVMLADMPGVRADGLNIDLRDNVLSIEGHVGDAVRSSERTMLREYETGSYRREFRLTKLIDQDKIDAALKDGVLRLTLPKAEAARPRRIEVRSA